MAGQQHRFDSEGQQAAGQFLAELADSTGGKFFDNNNDLDAGFRDAAVISEPGYILAFSPNSVKFDGKFHASKVALRQQSKGFTLHARKG